MFWICAGSSTDNTGLFLLLLSRAHRTSRPLLFLTPPHQWAGQGCTRSQRRQTQPGQLTTAVQRDTPHYMASCSAWKLSEWGRVRMLAGLTLLRDWLGINCLAASNSSPFAPFAPSQAFFSSPLSYWFGFHPPQIITLPLSQSTYFLTFTLAVLPLHLTAGAGVDEQQCGA